jgi:hypothetical protein
MSMMTEYLQQTIDLQKHMSKRLSRNVETPYVSIEDFVFQHGREQTLMPSPVGLRRVGQKQMCFMNATNKLANHCHMNGLAFEESEYVYCEGYATAISVFFPVLHAWLSPRNDLSKVIEVTWKPKPDVPAHYFGVPLKFPYVTNCCTTNKHYGVLDCWRNDYPLLTGKHNLEDALYESPVGVSK